MPPPWMSRAEIEVGFRLRRRPGERNQRPSEGCAEIVRRVKPHIIARYDGNSENE